MALPDFLIIGAMKCGTSTLAAQLAHQDGIFVTTPKEPNFFSDDAVHAKGLDWYRSLFEPAAPGDLLGEASTHYTKRPIHPDTLARLIPVLPAPRLVYMIRDPMDRIVSHYIHEWTMGAIGDTLEAALEAHPELIAYSRYGFQIAPWVEAFGPEAICLLSLEEMRRAPQATLDRVCRHIGFAGAPLWQETHAQVNASAERVRRLPFHDTLIAGKTATRLRRALVPEGLRRAIRTRRQMQARPELSPAARARLRPIFAEDRALLARLLPAAPAFDESYACLSQ